MVSVSDPRSSEMFIARPAACEDSPEPVRELTYFGVTVPWLLSQVAVIRERTKVLVAEVRGRRVEIPRQSKAVL